MITDRILEFAERPDLEGAILLTGWEDCIAGVFENLNGEKVVVYSVEKIIDTMTERDGLKVDEAWEHFYFNVHGAFLGPRTPVFIHQREIQELDGVAY